MKHEVHLNLWKREYSTCLWGRCNRLPCWSRPFIILLDPCTFRLPLTVLPLRFIRDAILGTDKPPELIFLPILLPPTIFPTELVIRGPKFPKDGDTEIPGTELRLPLAPKLEDKPWMLPPIFMLLLNAGPAPTFIPLPLTAECACGICKGAGNK